MEKLIRVKFSIRAKAYKEYNNQIQEMTFLLRLKVRLMTSMSKRKRQIRIVQNQSLLLKHWSLLHIRMASGARRVNKSLWISSQAISKTRSSIQSLLKRSLTAPKLTFLAFTAHSLLFSSSRMLSARRKKSGRWLQRKHKIGSSKPKLQTSTSLSESLVWF